MTRFARFLVVVAVTASVLRSQTARPTPADTSSAAPTIDLELAALLATNESAPFPVEYENATALEKVRFWERRARDRTAQGLAFIAKYPADPRRWTAAILLVSNFPPYFARDFSLLPAGEKPAPGEPVRRWNTSTFRLVERDSIAEVDFNRRREELRGALIAATDLLPADQERVEFQLVVAPKIGPTYGAARRGEPVDFAPVRALIADYATKFPNSEYAAGLAGGYITNLENVKPGSADAEWLFFSHSPNARLRELATSQLEKTSVRTNLTENPVEIAFTAVDGRMVDLKALRGRVVLVDFWATWCVPCIAELPNVKRVYAAYHAKGFEVVGIALENAKLTAKDTPGQTAEKLAKAKKVLTDFTAKEALPWPQYFDGKYWQNEISTRYVIDAIPAMFLLDQAGRIVSMDARGEKLEEEVKRLLKL